MPRYTIEIDGRPHWFQGPNRQITERFAQQWAANSGRERYDNGRQAPDPITGYLTTAARAVPGLTEIGASPAAVAGAAQDLILGKRPELSRGFNLARANQQATVDQFRSDHPIASANATAFGSVLPALIMGGGGLARNAVAVAGRPIGRDFAGAVSRLVSTGTRNAMAGGIAGAVYGGAQPGTLEERARSAVAAIPNSMAAGAALPAALGAGGATLRATRAAIRSVIPRVSAVASEVGDATGRALRGETPSDQARRLDDAQMAQGRHSAVAHLRRIGVTPELMTTAKTAAGGRPIATAEAMGPAGMALVRATAQRAGTTQTAIAALRPVLERRRPTRFLHAIEDSLGLSPQAVHGDAKTMWRASQSTASPLWHGVYDQLPPASAKLIDLLASDGIRAAKANASDKIERMGFSPEAFTPDNDFDDLSNTKMLPGLRLIDMTLKELEEKYAGRWDISKGEYANLQPKDYEVLDNISKIRDALSADHKGNETPFGLAQGTSGDLIATQSAYNQALGRLINPLEDPASFGDRLESLKPFELRAAQAAAGKDVYDHMVKYPLGADVLELPDVKTKLTKLFGSEATENLVGRLKSEGNQIKSWTVPNGIAGSVLPLITAATLPMGMATRNALGSLLVQDPDITGRVLGDFDAFPAEAATTPAAPSLGSSAALLAGITQKASPLDQPSDNPSVP